MAVEKSLVSGSMTMLLLGLLKGICRKGQKILQHYKKRKTGACQKDGRMAGICFRRDKRAGFSRIAEGNYG